MDDEDDIATARGLLYSWLHVTHPCVVGCRCGLCERTQAFIDKTRAPIPVAPTNGATDGRQQRLG